MNVEVYDIETLNNCFTYTGYNTKDNKWYQFVIHDSINQLGELYEHITNDLIMMVGFNNENFDYPVLHWILTNVKTLIMKPSYEIANLIYKEAQRIIHTEEYHVIPDKKKFVPQTDLFLIWHYNNKARRTSLKDLEFAMNMPNIEEMPIHHTSYIQENQIQEILNYNKNDVEATYQFLLVTLGLTDYSIYKNKNKIELREKLKRKFRIPCSNYPDVKIGEQLMLHLYARSTQQEVRDLKEQRTIRESIQLKDCIPTWCNIKSKEFTDFYNTVVNTVVTGQKGEFEKSIIFHGIRFDFGLGGSHGCIKSGVYKSDENDIILDLDVSSLYPSVAKSLNLYPAHLGPEFMELYSQFIDARIAEKHKPKNERDNVLIEGYKLLLNGTYGKSNENTSFMYDPLYTFKTTIGGQIFICMWAERMVEAVPELTFIQINTDGITIKLPRNKVDLIREVCNQLTVETTLVIEEAFYKQMIIRDVNNYIAEYEDSTEENEHLKLKGCFEIDKEFHKDSSMKIVPIALKKYFINGIPIEETIKTHQNIYDFCMRLKINHSSKAFYNTVDENGIKQHPLDRTTRYYVSNKGGGLTVYYNGSTEVTRINKGFVATLFNQYVQQDKYDINYRFYIEEAYKIHDAVVDYQLSLF
jgi:hypothetical protein